MIYGSRPFNEIKIEKALDCPIDLSDFSFALVYFILDESFAIYELEDIQGWSLEELKSLEKRGRVELSATYDGEEQKLLVLQISSSIEDLEPTKDFCFNMKNTRKKNIDIIRQQFNPLKKKKRSRPTNLSASSTQESSSFSAVNISLTDSPRDKAPQPENTRTPFFQQAGDWLHYSEVDTDSENPAANSPIVILNDSVYSLNGPKPILPSPSIDIDRPENNAEYMSALDKSTSIDQTLMQTIHQQMSIVEDKLTKQGDTLIKIEAALLAEFRIASKAPFTPLETIEMYRIFCDKLVTKEGFRLQVINYLAMVGGVNLRDFVKRSLRRLLNNAMQKIFNRRGSFGKLNFCEILEPLIKEASQICPVVNVRSEYTEYSIEQFIRLNLHNAADRDGGRDRRREFAKENREIRELCRKRTSSNIESPDEEEEVEFCEASLRKRGRPVTVRFVPV